MKSLLIPALAVAAAAAPTSKSYPTGNTGHSGHLGHTSKNDSYLVSLGPRPYYIINNMTDSPLKQKLQSCENKPVSIQQFSIGHRGGGTLQFPEETRQSEDAGARMGAGVLECDVSFTGDRGLVCRHSLCDLHTTTDILLRPELAKKCTIRKAMTGLGKMLCPGHGRTTNRRLRQSTVTRCSAPTRTSKIRHSSSLSPQLLSTRIHRLLIYTLT